MLSKLKTWYTEDFSHRIMYRQMGIHTDLLWGVTPRRWPPINRSAFRHMSVIHITFFVTWYQIEHGIWIDKQRVPPLTINASGSWYGTHSLFFSGVYRSEIKSIVEIDVWIVLFPWKKVFVVLVQQHYILIQIFDMLSTMNF